MALVRSGIALASIACCLTAASGTAAAAPRNGWGFGIADNVRHRHLVVPATINTAIDTHMTRMAPRIYRVQIPFDIMSHPDAVSRVAQIKQEIQNARNSGVQEVLATFSMGWEDYNAGRKWPNTHPPADWLYDQQTQAVIAEFDSLVDQWSPANEPNGGWQWLGDANDPEGPALLAQYYNKLMVAIPAGDELVSPEFIDRTDLNGDLIVGSDGQPELRVWINNYLAAGGGWGSHAALHPYGAVASKNLASIVEFNGLVGGAADVWFTEIGGRIHGGGIDPKYPQSEQVAWLVNFLKTSMKVTRAYYYNPWDDGAPTWDSALLNIDGTPRNAWVNWCAAANGMAVPTAPCLQPAAGDGSTGRGGE